MKGYKKLGSDFDDSVFKPLPKYEQMEQKRRKCRDLWDGVDALRSKDTEYLPKKEMEKEEVYRKRLLHATLYNMFSRAIEGLVGRVFSKVMAVEEVPESNADWYENIDFLGNNVDMFVRDVFETAVTEGMSFILVDFPRARHFDSREDEKSVNRRPYWVHVKPYEVIGWRYVSVDGPPELQHIRVRQIIEQTDEDNEYGVKSFERVRVYERGMCKEYLREVDGGSDVWYIEHLMSLEMIPIIPVFTKKTELMCAMPPLYDLAVLNLRHYQSNSSQDHILDYVRFPVLFGKLLFSDAQTEAPMGPSNMIHSNNEEADLKYVEHTGAAIKSGAESLKDLEDRMAVMSHEPLMTRRSGTETATRTAIDSAAANSLLQCWALQLKDALEQALVITSAWVNQDISNAGTISMNIDYALTISQVDVKNLLELRQAGELSRGTLWEELSRRGLLGPDFVPETEEQLINAEGQVKVGGDGLLLKMVEKEILPRQVLFEEIKRRGMIPQDLDWQDVQAMRDDDNRTATGPTGALFGL